MMNQTRTIVLSFLLGVLCHSLMAQSPYEDVYIIKNTQWSRLYDAGFSQITNNLNSSLGTAEDNFLGNGEWELVIDAADVLGSDKVVVRYNEGSWPFWETKFMALDVHIVESVVIPQKDYISVVVNTENNIFDVVANDSTSAGGLEITHLALVNNGDAEIASDHSISFTPTPDFLGMAYINYVACDSIGTCASGQVSVCVVDPDIEPDSDTVKYSTSKNTALTVLLPGSDFDVNIDPLHGTVDSVGNDVVLYTPDEDFSGQDTFQLMNPEGVTRTVVVTVIYVPDQNGFAIDDYVYTSRNNAISFNVFDNDLTDNFPIDDYFDPAGELVYLGDGEFHYTPEDDFEGLVKFNYTICDVFDISCETADVYIYVDDHEPMNDDLYHIVTPKNTPVILNYEVPVLSFDFEVVQDPINGHLTPFPGYQYIYIDCHEVYGYNQVVYDPDQDYVGTDEFEIQYCVTGADSCTPVRIEVIVLDLVPDTTCPCVQNCVWPGDANSDGKVNVRDLLPLGWHMGLSGPSRPEAEAEEWYGQHCEDWRWELASNGSNIKHVDTDGDGILLSSDTSKILENYYSVHTVIPDEDYDIKAYPFDLVIETPDVTTGDLAIISIYAGNETYPMIDYHGLSFSLDYNVNVVDSGSMRFIAEHDSWLTLDGPSLDLGVVPFEGKIDAAITRTDGRAVSGGGKIGEVVFIVGDEDIEGFQSGDILFRDYKIRIDDIYAQRGDGREVKIPGSESIMTVKYDGTEQNDPEVKESLLYVYPNPVGDELTVHLNGSDQISEMHLMDLSGRVIQQQLGLQHERRQLDVSDLPDGFYLLEVMTSSERIIKKVQVVH